MYVSKEENSRLTHCFSVLLCLLASTWLVSFLASKKETKQVDAKYIQAYTFLECLKIQKASKTLILLAFGISFKRRVRDSNPRTCNSQQFSRLPQSTTLPTLHHKYITTYTLKKFY